MEKKGSLALWLETKGHFFVHDQRNDEREREKERDPFTRSVSSEFSTWLRHARINDFLIREHYFFPPFHSSSLRQPNQPNYFSVLSSTPYSSDTFTRVLRLTAFLTSHGNVRGPRRFVKVDVNAVSRSGYPRDTLDRLDESNDCVSAKVCDKETRFHVGFCGRERRLRRQTERTVRTGAPLCFFSFRARQRLSHGEDRKIRVEVNLYRVVRGTCD